MHLVCGQGVLGVLGEDEEVQITEESDGEASGSDAEMQST
jgi:hypothetical protein